MKLGLVGLTSNVGGSPGIVILLSMGVANNAAASRGVRGGDGATSLGRRSGGKHSSAMAWAWRGDCVPEAGVAGGDRCIETRSKELGGTSLGGVWGRLLGVAALRGRPPWPSVMAAEGGRLKDAALQGGVPEPSDVDRVRGERGLCLDTDSGCDFQR